MVCLLCCLSLTGCSFHMPVFVPDDENVIALGKAVVSDIDAMTMTTHGLIVYASDSGYRIQRYTQETNGKLSDVLHGSRKLETDVTDQAQDVSFDTWQPSKNASSETIEWYLNGKKDAYYQKKNTEKWIGYTSGKSIVDSDWWEHQFDNSAIKYGGISDGCLILEATYTDVDLTKLFQHLNVDIQTDTSSSDMSVRIFLNRWTGQIKQIQVRLSDTGSGIQTVIDDVTYRMTTCSFDITVSEESESVTIPKDVGSVSLVSPSSDMLLADTQTINAKQGLSLGDSCYVNVEKTESFDEIAYDAEKYQISVSSSSVLDGQPVMTIRLIDGVDAYSYAQTDLSEVVPFYRDNGLEDLAVSTKLQQTVIAGQPVYWYMAQYTEGSMEFVNIDVVAYMELTDTSVAKVVISSRVDKGESLVLNESYAKAMWSHIIVEQAGDNHE